jgi:signal transduction histidine kinase
VPDFQQLARRISDRLREVPPILQDLGLVAVIGVLQAALLGGPGERSLLTLLVLVEPLPLLLRRRHPMLTMALVVAADLGEVLAGTPISSVGATVVAAAYAAGAYARRPRALLSLALGVVGLIVLSRTSVGLADRVGVILVTTCAWWVGASIQERRRYAAELEAAHAALAERAVVAERLRLARELHDVVAHSLAIIALHSTVGAHNAAERPQDAVQAFEAINSATRSALLELRTLLMVLRYSDRDSDRDGVSQPALSDLGELVERARQAGVTVEVSVTGDVGGVPRAVGLSAYRIVQEALTNVVKHAAPTSATVSVAVLPGSVRVKVVNGAPARGHRLPAPRGGSGLVGMRERAAAFGGHLQAATGSDGGWAVDADLIFEEPVG